MSIDEHGGGEADLERVLRERTDVFERERRILATVATRPEIERLLERLSRTGAAAAPRR